MKLQVKTGGGVPFARKEDYEYDGTQYEADLKTGDTVKILDSGNEESGNYGVQYNFKIKTRNGEKKLAFNQSTVNVLVQEFGDETENWVNKDVKVILKKDVIAGKKAIIAYLVTPEWQIDEYGELYKAQGTSTQNTPENASEGQNLPPQTPQNNESGNTQTVTPGHPDYVDPSNIPF